MELHLVADTNLFFEFKTLEQLPWSELSADPIVILLTRPVLDEIDKYKKGTGRTRDRAIEIFGRFRAMLETRVSEVEIRASSPRVVLRRMTNVCTCSHAADLDDERYTLARGGTVYLLLDKYSAPTWPPLSEWDRVVGTKAFTWVPHAVHGLVPEIEVHNDSVEDLEVGVGRLRQSMSTATMSDIGRADMEMD